MSPIWILPPTSESEVAEPTLISAATDDVEMALSRLCEQFKGKENIEKFLRAIATPAISLRAALEQLRTERSIDDAVGAQLDDIGAIVGQARDGLGDDDYRRYLRARIAANRSHGRAEDLIKVASLVVSDAAAWIEIYEPVTTVSGGGGIIVRVRALTVSDALASIVLAFLEDATPAAVRVVLETLVVPEEDSFTMAVEAYSNAPLTVGMTTFAIYGSFVDSMFPSSGTIIIDAGLAIEETVTYSGKALNGDGTLQLLNVSALTQNHPGSADGVHLYLDEGDLGFGDDDEPGHYALTREDTETAGTTGGRMIDDRS